MKLILYTDGGARGNPGPAAIGVVLLDANKKQIATHKAKIGTATNNIAEYKALIKGLNIALSKGASEVKVYSDSELMVRQLKGEYRVKSTNLKPLFDNVQKKIEKLDKFSVQHVFRTNPGIVKADALVNAALDS